MYDPGGFACPQPVPEPESAEYAADEFTLDGRSVRIRAVKDHPDEGRPVRHGVAAVPGGADPALRCRRRG
ncbi:hypothetical protein GCM10010211_52900 [Streptomyces albospinus]|uniref:Uncharacterized protein n=1 Tax=Streptomyces albospinus TaxID=285515 RepID=A0ABQ2VDQ0_9ACTN|nr:hypothetical protein GCM10010211_52900 [Streptomyces albospinus]